MIAALLLLSQSISLPALTPSVMDAIRFSAYRRSRTRMRLTADITFLVDDRGRVLTCQSADDARDGSAVEFVCRRIRSARFDPATGFDGEPIHGYYVLLAGPRRVDAFLAFDDVEYSGVVSALVEVDESGRARHCIPNTGEGFPYGFLGPRICEIIENSPLDIALGQDNQPVPYVRSIQVAINMDVAG